MKSTDKFRMIIWRQIEDSLLVLKNDDVNTLQMIFRPSHHRTEPWDRTALTPAYSFWNQKIGFLKPDRLNEP